MKVLRCVRIPSLQRGTRRDRQRMLELSMDCLYCMKADAHGKNNRNTVLRAPVRGARTDAGRGNGGLLFEQDLHRHRIMLGLSPGSVRALGAHHPCPDLSAESGQRS